MNPKIAYLNSRHPATSQTFILREVSSLREMGFNIQVASINDTDLPQMKRTSEEKQEIARTFYVKRAGWKKVISSFLRTLVKRPMSLIKGFFYSICLGAFDFRRMFYHLFYFAEALVVGCWMEDENIKHLHVHFANPAGTVALIVSKIFSFTHSITVHGPDIFDDVTLNALPRKIQEAKFVCCIGYYTKSQLMRLSVPEQWEKLEIAPLGVDTQLFSPKVFRPKPAPYEILCVGRQVSAKGHLIAIAALEKLLQRGYNVKLRLLGGGPLHKEILKSINRRNLSSHVIVEGAVNHTRVIEAYRSADIFALPSFAEGIPVVLMEAMAVELPCVATFVNGIPELIRDKVDGLLVMPADSDGLAKAIESLIANAEYRKQIGQAGRQRILEKYAIQTNIKKLATIFERRLT